MICVNVLNDRVINELNSDNMGRCVICVVSAGFNFSAQTKLHSSIEHSAEDQDTDIYF